MAFPGVEPLLTADCACGWSFGPSAMDTTLTFVGHHQDVHALERMRTSGT